MARYFFDRHDDRVEIDEEGVECERLASVRSHVQRTLSEISSRRVLQNQSSHVRNIVRDASADDVLAATLVIFIDDADPDDGDPLEACNANRPLPATVQSTPRLGLSRCPATPPREEPA